MPPPIPVPPDNGLGILNYFDTLVKIISPLVLAVVSLAVWAFRQQGSTHDKLQTAFEDHVKSDDDIHDKLFTGQHETAEKLAELIGEHKARRDEDRPMYRRT